MPYLFSASHVNFAWYGLHYLHSMETLPSEIKHYFLQEQHIMRHAASATNSTWSDMFIKTTFMRYGHSQGGLTGITPNDNATQCWAISLHACSSLISCKTAMRNQTPRTRTHHKEETPGRIQADAADRQKLHEKLSQCTNPLDPNDHPPALFNIATGRLAEPSMNIHRTLQIWTSSMESFAGKLPEQFHDPIGSPFITMSTTRNTTKLGSGQTFDTRVIFSRKLWITNSCDFDLDNLLLSSPILSAPRWWQYATADLKTKMKNCLVVEQSLRTVTHPDVIMLDGCALLWSVYWPASGTMGDVVQIMVEYLQKPMDYTDVFPVFDRYHPYSPQGSTWIQRSSESAKQQLYFNTHSRPFHLNMFHWPHRKQCTNNWYDTSKSNPLLSRKQMSKKTWITSPDHIPDEVHDGVHIKGVIWPSVMKKLMLLSLTMPYH